MIPARFDYHAPTTLRQAIGLLSRYGDDAKVLAGGQSLIPLLKFRLATPAHIIDLGRVEGLSYIRGVRGGLAIGAMTTHDQVHTSPLVGERFPLLRACAGRIADPQVRNMGTIGGSLAHADPAADYPAPLLALEARVRTAGPRGRRTIPLDGFFVAPFTTALEPGEVITEVRIPYLPPRTGTSYQKFANKASHFAIVGVAVVLTLGARGEIRRARIGVTGAAPVPFRATAAEQALAGRRPTPRAIAGAVALVGQGVDFNGDIHASARYRAHLLQVMTRRALEEALRWAGAG